MTKRQRVLVGFGFVLSAFAVYGVEDRLDKLERRMERLEQDQLRIRTWVSALHQLVWPDGEDE